MMTLKTTQTESTMMHSSAGGITINDNIMQDKEINGLVDRKNQYVPLQCFIDITSGVIRTLYRK